MYSHGISKSKRIAVCVMGIMMLAFILFSAFFIAHAATHDCTGENCPICECIAECENTLRQMSGSIAPAAATVLPIIIFLISMCLSALIITQETPVSKKIRLNN